MHELSLAHSLIDQILDLAAEHQASRVLRVRVTLGPFSGVVRDSFEFGFNVLKKEQPQTEDALLDQRTLKGAVATAQAEHAGLPRVGQLLADVVHEADFTGAEQVLAYTAHDFRVIAKINERTAGLG